MTKAPLVALLIAALSPVLVMAQPTTKSEFRPNQFLASDSGTSSHRLTRPAGDDQAGGSASTAAPNNNGTTIGTDEESSSAAVNQDELKSKIQEWRKEAAARDAAAAAAGKNPSSEDAAHQSSSASAPSSPAPSQEQPRRILQGSIDQYGEAKQQAFNIGLGIVAKKESESAFPANILQVLQGSKALAAGVHSGDHILKESLDKDVVHLTLKRAQKIFDVSIATGGSAMFDLTADQPVVKTGVGHTALQAGATRTNLTAGTTSVQLKANVVEQMRDHDVVLILDMSGSMTTRDCQGLSRWDWVGRQSNELAQAAQQASSDLTVMLFSSGFQVMEHVNPSLIPFIFAHVHPGGGTILGAPLNEAMVHYFNARSANPSVKPLIVTIITDGLPGDFGAVRKILIDAENATKRDGEVSVTFLLINGNLSGNRLMEELDSQLPAQRDIVNLVEFDQVLQLGVKQALYEALSGRVLRNVPLSSPTMNPFGNSLNGLLNGRRMPMGPPFGMRGAPYSPSGQFNFGSPLNTQPSYQPGVRSYP